MSSELRLHCVCRWVVSTWYLQMSCECMVSADEYCCECLTSADELRMEGISRWTTSGGHHQVNYKWKASAGELRVEGIIRWTTSGGHQQVNYEWRALAGELRVEGISRWTTSGGHQQVNKRKQDQQNVSVECNWIQNMKRCQNDIKACLHQTDLYLEESISLQWC